MSDTPYKMFEILTLIGFLILISIALASCNLTMNMVHTEGTASDVVDETTSTDAKVDPTLSIPLLK